MKKTLVKTLCCALLVSNFAACGNVPTESETPREAAAEVSTESTVPDTSESEESVESVESTTAEVTYSVELTAIGDNKISVIETYRTLTDLGLKEAKDKIDSAPCIILETTNQEEAELYKTSFEECGATITILDGTEETEPATTSDEAIDTTESTESTESSASETTGANFSVDNIFSITDVGTVLVGTVKQGSIKLGDSAVIILEDGTEIPVTINRIEVFGGFLEVAEEGENVSLGFEEDIEADSVLTAVSVTVKEN